MIASLCSKQRNLENQDASILLPHDGRRAFVDEEGTELHDLGAARLEANRMVGMILAQGEISNEAWQLFVADQSQTIVLLLAFTSELRDPEGGAP
jgi:hypothetical protein